MGALPDSPPAPQTEFELSLRSRLVVPCVAALALALSPLLSSMPASADAGPAVADLMVLGTAFSVSNGTVLNWTGAELFPGLDAGAPTVAVDLAGGQATFTVVDGDRTDRLTTAWPLRLGVWSLSRSGPDPEQRLTVEHRAPRVACTFTDGSLDVRQADRTPTGGVSALLLTFRGGGCGIGSAEVLSGAVRIGAPSPMGVPFATAAGVPTQALSGTVLTLPIVVTNRGDGPWTGRALGVAADPRFTRRFRVVPEASDCVDHTVQPGQSCTVTVTATVTSSNIRDNLEVAGDGPSDLVVPLDVEGHDPVPMPAGVVLTPGRSNARLTWDAPAVQPYQGYRVYDVTGGKRVMLATVDKSAVAVLVPGDGPRTLQLVAAIGTFAESDPVTVDVPAVGTELVASNRSTFKPIAFSEPGSGLAVQARTVNVYGLLQLDGARRSYLMEQDLYVCPVDTESCAAVPGTSATTSGYAIAPVWVADGRIAFTRQLFGAETSELWVVGRDGSGLRKVRTFTRADALTASPAPDEVIIRYGDALHRIRLSDGHDAVIPHTGWQEIGWVDDYSVTSQGQLVLQQRIDESGNTYSATTVWVMGLDGTNRHTLNLPAGSNQHVRFDQTGTRLAFARYTADFDATVWVANADGSGARQLSDQVGDWSDFTWSSADTTAPIPTPAAPPSVSPTTTSLSWGGSDGWGTGIASYDVRERYASASSDLGAYVYPSVWQGLTAPSLALKLAAGYEYCFSMRARDRAGNVSAWTADRCTAAVLDDRSLSVSSGWVRGTSSSYFNGTLTKAARTGVSLSRTSVRGRRVAVVATRCSSCGAVDVYWGSTKLGRVSLAGATGYRQVFWLPLSASTRSGTVIIRTVSAKLVAVDGIAVLH